MREPEERLDPEKFGIVPSETTPLNNVRMEAEWLGRLASRSHKRPIIWRIAGVVLGIVMALPGCFLIFFLLENWESGNAYGLFMVSLWTMLGARIIWVNLRN